jgi:hypothetical protein
MMARAAIGRKSRRKAFFCTSGPMIKQSGTEGALRTRADGAQNEAIATSYLVTGEEFQHNGGGIELSVTAGCTRRSRR